MNQDSSGKTISSSNTAKGTLGEETYILNMYLQKGTYPVFLELADKFFSIIQSQLANQDKTEDVKKTEIENNDHIMASQT